MNETIENLKTRRSIRKFKDEQITDEFKIRKPLKNFQHGTEAISR